MHDNPLKTKFIPMSLEGLDHILAPGRLVVVAGHDNHGADTLAVNTARTAAIDHGIPTLLSSCRSLEGEMRDRIIAAYAGVPFDHVTSGMLTEQETGRIIVAAGPIETAPLFTNCGGHWLDRDLYLARKFHAQLVVIEAAHLLADREPLEGDEARAEHQSRELKIAAMDLGIPILVSVPLVEGPNRGGGSFLADFGYRYSFAQHADVVLMAYRPDANGDDSRFGEIDITIAKHRNGPTDKVTAFHQGIFDRIIDLPF